MALHYARVVGVIGRMDDMQAELLRETGQLLQRHFIHGTLGVRRLKTQADRDASFRRHERRQFP